MKNKLFIYSILIFLTQLSIAQRPKIGLTLSGGGAKGLSHIGLLQAIDSAGLKIDYITGTSMGAIIGAMYATGYSGNQIDSISKTLNWIELMSGKPQYANIGVEEKDEFGKYTFEIPMKNFKPQLGTGFIESEEIWLKFSEIFFHVYDQKDFTQFNIPFKCIATDLSTGEAVVLESGELVKALRSSMALPGIFSAVEAEGTHYVDGGIVRNFPVVDVKEMGADYVIGVNLYSGLSDSKDLKSAVDAMYQIMNYRDAYDLEKEKKLCDLIIEPPVQDYNAGSFSDANKIVDIGNQMRELYYPKFKALADSINGIEENNYNPYTRYKPKTNVIIDDYEIIGLQNIDEKMLIANSSSTNGQPISVAEISEKFRKIYSTVNIKSVYYELKPTSAGHAKMIIHIQEKNQEILKIGFSYHSFISPALVLNYTARNIFRDKSRSLVKIALSQDLKGWLEHRYFFGKRYNHAVSGSIKHIQQRLNSFDNRQITSQYKSFNTEAKIGYNYYPSHKSAWGADMSYMYVKYNPQISSNEIYKGSKNTLNFNTSYVLNTTDRLFLPRSGVDLTINVGVQLNRNYKNQVFSAYENNTYKTNAPLYQANCIFNWFTALNQKTSLLGNLQTGIILADETFEYDHLLVGGNQQIYNKQFSLVGYYDGQLSSTSISSGLLGIQYKVWDELYLLAKANIGLYDYISAQGLADDISKQFISGFSANIAYNLSVLPFELSLNYSPEIGELFSLIRIGFNF